MHAITPLLLQFEGGETYVCLECFLPIISVGRDGYRVWTHWGPQ